MDRRLLYVEDDEVLAAVTSRALKKRGFDVAHFENIAGVRASKKLHSFSHALLDLKLEDGNSLSLIADLKGATNGAMKILVLTGYASVATAVQAVKSGAANYLAKPATIEQILQAFEEYQVSEPVSVESEPVNLSLKRLEWEHIQQVLVENDGNIAATARQLKMHRRTLQRKLKKKPVAQ